MKDTRETIKRKKDIDTASDHLNIMSSGSKLKKTTLSADERLSLRKIIHRYRLELGRFAILCILFVILENITGTAISAANIRNVLQSVAPLFFIVLGQLLVMIAGGIDFSVGSVFSFAGMVCAIVMVHYGIFPAVIAALVVGAACGAINGFLVVKVRIAPFIATFAMYVIAASLAFVTTNGNSITLKHEAFSLFDRGHFIYGIPNYITYIIIAVVLFHFVLKKTIFGRQIYATGSNEEAARLVGIPTGKIKFSAYICCGFLTAIAAIMNASFLMTVECSAGQGLELNIIAAAIIGGASLFGGTGTALGALIGTVIVESIRNGINLLGINAFWSGTVTGVITLLTVLLSNVHQRQKN
ncbi:ABC transporter permease [Petroclostridium sp. X23]|uniref:ABC transporter permease n=1 Tax=Petroclostridium sp. X23 TaxID=3045146 RepID=UPI0024ACDC3B|nr:ABC transporter permease [Petroclostridium sp. X23]WHH57278.1 ABC transporter permease [Petroclostridium sp. X23]